MATVFINDAALDNSATYVQAQNPDTPWKTPYATILSGSFVAADIASIVSGTYTANSASAFYGGSNSHQYSKSGNWVAQITRGVIYKTVSTAASSPIGYVSGAPAAAIMNTTGVVFDGEGTNQQLLAINTNVNAWTTTWTDCSFINPLLRCVNLDFNNNGLDVGNHTFTRCNFSGSPTNNCVEGANGNLAGATAAVITFNQPNFNVTHNGSIFGITQDQQSAGSIAYTVDGITGLVETTATAAAAAGVYLRCNTATIRNALNFEVRAPAAATSESYGLYIYPNAANLVAPTITSNRLYFNGPAGHGISMGNSLGGAAGLISNAKVLGNVVRGNYYSLKTPHGITVGVSTSTEAAGNVSKDIYVGILASKATTFNIHNNSVYDNYGVGLYAKGNTSGTFQANNVYYSGKFPQRDLGCMSVNQQSDGTVNAATSFINNLVVVGVPWAQWKQNSGTVFEKLVQIQTGQTATFTGNTYIIPDDVPDSALAFVHSGPNGGGAGTGVSIATWTAGGTFGGATVSGETVIKLPIAVINQLISGGASGASGILSSKIVS